MCGGSISAGVLGGPVRAAGGVTWEMMVFNYAKTPHHGQKQKIVAQEQFSACYREEACHSCHVMSCPKQVCKALQQTLWVALVSDAFWQLG